LGLRTLLHLAALLSTQGSRGLIHGRWNARMADNSPCLMDPGDISPQIMSLQKPTPFHHPHSLGTLAGQHRGCLFHEPTTL